MFGLPMETHCYLVVVTGYNLRSIILKSSADSIQQLKPHLTAKYRDIPEGEEFHGCEC
jgi:hypothetical protein